MKLSDLQAGMRVRVRGVETPFYVQSIIDDYLSLEFNRNVIIVKYFNDLKSEKTSEYDIMEVFDYSYFVGWETIWKRNNGNDDAADVWEHFRKGFLEKHSIYIKKEEKGMKELYNLIDNVYFNESKRTTTIKFKNGDISKATATVGTEFCEHAGFMAALFKYQYGNVKDLETFIKRKGERQ